MFVFRSFSASDSTLRAARRARWMAGGVLNLFALTLIVNELAPAWLAS